MPVEDSGGSAQQVINFQTQTGATELTFYLDPTKTAYKTYKIIKASTCYLIDPNFVVREKVEEGVNERFLSDAVTRYAQLGAK